MQNLIRGFTKPGNSQALRTRIFSAAFWSFAGAVSQKLLLLATSFLCVYILGKAGYGKLSIVRSTIQIFILLGSVGMGSTATKYIAEYRDSCREKLQGIYSIVNLIGFGCGLLATLLVFCFAKQIAFYLKDPSIVNCIRIGALLLFFSIINSIQTGILAGMECFKEIAIITAIGGVIEFVCIICGAWLGSITGALLGYGIGFLCLSIINQYAIWKNGYEEFRFSLKAITASEFKKLLLFSIPLLWSSFLVSPVMWFTQTMLVRSSSFAELGVYAAADQWRMVLLFVPSTLSRIVLPLLANVDGQKDTRSYLKILMANLYINAGSTVVFFLGFIMISPIILKLYHFPLSDIWLFIVLAGSTIFNALAAVFGQAIISKEKNWIGFLFNLGWGIMVIGFTALFLQMQLGALALALALLCSYVLHALFQGVYFMIFLKKYKQESEK